MTNVRQFLNDMKFPANKAEIIRFARERNAPSDLLRSIEGLQDRPYNDASEVARAVSLF